MENPFFLPIKMVQPSQLYISDEKFSAVQQTWDPGEMFPLPVKVLDKKYVLTDGHTRAVFAYQQGLQQIKVVLDQDDLDWDAYRTCVGWCIHAGICEVSDLSNRIIAHHDFEILWIERCRIMHTELEAARHKLLITG